MSPEVVEEAPFFFFPYHTEGNRLLGCQSPTLHLLPPDPVHRKPWPHQALFTKQRRRGTQTPRTPLHMLYLSTDSLLRSSVLPDNLSLKNFPPFPFLMLLSRKALASHHVLKEAALLQVQTPILPLPYPVKAMRTVLE